MAGSELFGSELFQLFVGVAMMQHEHAWAGTGNHGCETMGTQLFDQRPRRFHQRSAIRLMQTILRGGEQQRVSIARAVAKNPRLLLCDEPTGALDSKSTDELLGLFEQINKRGQTILMVTHSVKAASHAQRILFIKDGELFHQIYRGECTDQQLYQKISDTLTILASGGEVK